MWRTFHGLGCCSRLAKEKLEPRDRHPLPSISYIESRAPKAAGPWYWLLEDSSSSPSRISLPSQRLPRAHACAHGQVGQFEGGSSSRLFDSFSSRRHSVLSSSRSIDLACAAHATISVRSFGTIIRSRHAVLHHEHGSSRAPRLCIKSRGTQERRLGSLRFRKKDVQLGIIQKPFAAMA